MKQMLLALALVSGVAVAQPVQVDPAALRDSALKDDTAWTIVRDLTTEIGPRLAGTNAEARAHDWAVVRLKSLGFQNVRFKPLDRYCSHSE